MRVPAADAQPRACMAFTDQGLAERPDAPGTRWVAAITSSRECSIRSQILIRDDEGRQQLDGVARVPGDLGQEPVVLEQRNVTSWQNSPCCGFQKVPARLELQRRGRANSMPIIRNPCRVSRTNS